MRHKPKFIKSTETVQFVPLPNKALQFLQKPYPDLDGSAFTQSLPFFTRLLRALSRKMKVLP